MAEERSAERPGASPGSTGVNVRWNDSNLKSSYVNVCNVSSTREEVVLLFGLNQTWNTGQRDVTIQLTDRIILNPHAAKRLNVVLTNALREYEARFGMLHVDMRRPEEPTNGEAHQPEEATQQVQPS
jgi:hypothetical protein